MALDVLIGTILVLGVMILVHEWGHFIVARFFGVRVDVFSIGFGPRLFGWKRGATDYRISALPLGGYVRMAGQDLSEVDSNDVAPTGAPDELMSKPRWQRILISFAGPAVNLIMPILLLTGVFAVKGVPYPAYMDKPAIIAGLNEADPLRNAGVTAGDKIVEVNGVATPTWEKAAEQLASLKSQVQVHFTVEHEGMSRRVDAPGSVLAQVDAPSWYVPMPPIVLYVTKGMPASRAGLKPDDLVMSVNGKPIENWTVFVDSIKHSNGAAVNTVVNRGGKLITVVLRPETGPGEDGKPTYRIGVLGPKPVFAYKKVTFVASVENAGEATWYGTEQLLGIVGKLFSGRVSVNQLQGVVRIAGQAGQAVHEGPSEVVNLMAMISLNLGILNLLPIPILDGGNILLLTLESLWRRDFSMAFKERFVQVGLVFLLVLFAVVMYNDVASYLPFHT
jgi:regulator of sigma E protease